MGSEMCIRDRDQVEAGGEGDGAGEGGVAEHLGDAEEPVLERLGACLLYTSDAADERSSVDLGGRRIIKKKKTRE